MVAASRDRWIKVVPAPLARYGAAILIVVIAYVGQLALWPYIPPSPDLLFYPAIFVAARIGGAGPGCAAAALSALLILYSFVPPMGRLAVTDARDMLNVFIFLGVTFGISMVTGSLRAALEREREVARVAERQKHATDEAWSMFAHDLRGPLHSITLGSAELCRRLGADVDKQERARVSRIVDVIQRSSDRARELLQDALDAMRLSEGALAIGTGRHSARSLCERALEVLAPEAKKKGVELVCDAIDAEVECDDRRIVQVLANLVGNAVKFTDRGGRVVVHVERLGRRARFAVEDTGRGIPQEELDRIFVKNWTRDTSGTGTGLGLWIARAIVEAHGATLTVRSQVGRGSTFSFSLPFSDGARAEAQPVPSRAS